jgi:hypothetical protein
MAAGVVEKFEVSFKMVIGFFLRKGGVSLSSLAPCTFRLPKTFRELRFILQIDLRCALETPFFSNVIE